MWNETTPKIKQSIVLLNITLNIGPIICVSFNNLVTFNNQIVRSLKRSQRTCPETWIFLPALNTIMDKGPG